MLRPQLGHRKCEHAVACPRESHNSHPQLLAQIAKVFAMETECDLDSGDCCASSPIGLNR